MFFGSRQISLGKQSVLVGILNTTPDSFSDGGQFDVVAAAVARGLQMLDEGAGMIDIGGESTRPGFAAVSEKDEIARIVPVIEGILKSRPTAILSVDTSKAVVAKAALTVGCLTVNDIWGFQSDSEMAGVVGESKASAILMRNGRDGVADGSILDRVRASWDRSLAIAKSGGVEASRIVLDPGIGFGTTRQEDLDVLRGLSVLQKYGFPIMLGASRKRITAVPSGAVLGERLEATLATTAAGIAAGVDFFRVHDVLENGRLAIMSDLIYRGGSLDG